MRAFGYVVSDTNGRITRGDLWARDAQHARAQVAARGFILEVSPASTVGPRLRGSRAARLGLIRSLSTQLGAGVSLQRAMQCVANRRWPKGLAAGIEEVASMVAEGEGLAVSLHRAGIVSQTVLSLIQTGESTGELATALRHTVGQLEHEQAAVLQLRSALTYPAILALTALLSLGVIVVIVLPRFAEIIADLGAQPPLLAVPLLWSSSVIRRHEWLVAVAATGSAWLMFALYGHAGARARCLSYLGRAPFVRGTVALWHRARLCRELGTMLTAGMTVSAALQHAARSRTDRDVTVGLRKSLDMVANGDRLSQALLTAGMLPEHLTPMVEAGEATAQLGEMLHAAAGELEGDLARRMETGLAALQPALVLLFGGMIAVVAASILQTLYSVTPTF